MKFRRDIFRRIGENYTACARGERPSFLRFLLAPLSWLNYIGTACLDFFYRRGLKRVETTQRPLISVGNLTWGGTNKTPFVETVARSMMAFGIKTGVVSRGYTGGRTRQKNAPLIITGGCGDRNEAGDEPVMLSRRLPDMPIAVSRRRSIGAAALAEQGVELIIADDAFQHRSLARDADVVLIDAACPFGNGSLVPAGILREPIKALTRAHIVVITKTDQTTPDALQKLRATIERYVPREKIFTSRMKMERWSSWDGKNLTPIAPPKSRLRVLAFSAIGAPESFARSLSDAGIEIVCERRFRDHHRYSESELADFFCAAQKINADALVCTEKDLCNLPRGWRPSVDCCPLIVPGAAAVLDEPERFMNALTDVLRPRIVVASNGYGEDAIGTLLASRLRERFRSAVVLAFPLVGRGDAYARENFPVKSSPSVTPSGGVIKYRLRDLLGDMRAGLIRHVKSQLRDWQKLRSVVLTPICVGDVYLLLHTLWGSGARPLFLATAKTVYISGHWRIERALIRFAARRTWTRDAATAEQLSRAGADALYAGNPIMDLLGCATFNPPSAPSPNDTPVILLLPGSRLRAYTDVNLLLDAAILLNAARRASFRMILAPTIDPVRLSKSCDGWTREADSLRREDVRVDLTDAPVAEAAPGASLLIGLGGTANQLCAGLGIPVVSIDEKGKRVQKKILGDAEILVPPTARALADAALLVLSDEKLYRSMSEAGRRNMGAPGALEDVVETTARELGFDARDKLYERLKRGAK